MDTLNNLLPGLVAGLSSKIRSQLLSLEEDKPVPL